MIKLIQEFKALLGLFIFGELIQWPLHKLQL